MSEKKSFLNILSNIALGIKVAYESSHLYFILKCLILLFNSVIPIISIYLWRVIINEVAGNRNARLIITLLSIYLIIKVMTYFSYSLNNYVIDRYWDFRTKHMNKIMLSKVSRVSIADLESSTFSNKLNNVRYNFGALHDAAWIPFDILTDLVNVISSFVILAGFNVWLSLLTVILLIPHLVYGQHYAKKMYNLQNEQAKYRRIMDYCDGVFFDNAVQFEIKLNHIGRYFIDKGEGIFQKLYKVNQSNRRKNMVIDSLLSVLSHLGKLVVILVSMNGYVVGRLAIGDLQYNISIADRLHSNVVTLIRDINSFAVNNKQIDNLREFMAIKTEEQSNGSIIAPSCPKIEFRNVAFKYPNTDHYVLKDCSFTIEPHEKLGLIGLNGAGKSTVIKLLFRFYDPDEGEILLDDINIKEYNIHSVRKVFGVLFQDYVTYCLPLREIIALPDFDERYNEEKLKRACDISGVSSVIKDWEDGFDSVLGRYYADNGKDLSGGQWQLVGLARAYFRDCEIMILDEPSAALDPIAEDRIFEQLYHLSDGKGAVTISHRLSNTTLADKIIVLKDGHIIEQGSHNELLNTGGEYARLFELQASKYE